VVRPTQFTHVLYGPKIRSNLISIASIVDQGFKVAFTETGCTVSNQGIAKAIGKQQGNLYFQTGLQEIPLAGVTQMNDRTTEAIWHWCIGHRRLNPQAMQNINKSVTGFEVIQSK